MNRCGCSHPGCSGSHQAACLCLHDHAGGLVHDQHCPACNGTGTPTGELEPALAPSPVSAPPAAAGCVEHDPVRAVVDVRLDAAGRPVALLWWIECHRCGEVLDVPTDQDHEQDQDYGQAHEREAVA